MCQHQEDTCLAGPTRRMTRIICAARHGPKEIDLRPESVSECSNNSETIINILLTNSKFINVLWIFFLQVGAYVASPVARCGAWCVALPAPTVP